MIWPPPRYRSGGEVEVVVVGAAVAYVPPHRETKSIRTNCNLVRRTLDPESSRNG